jgi:hypothetical protein
MQPTSKQHIAREKDITLANNFVDFGFDDTAFDFDMDAIGAEDWGDAGLTFGDEDNEEQRGRREGDDSISMEIGRRAASIAVGSPRISVASNLRGAFDADFSALNKSVDPFAADFGAGGGFDDNAFDVNFDGPREFGMDLTYEGAEPLEKTLGSGSRASESFLIQPVITNVITDVGETVY